MDRITRKELKSDKFALEVEHTVTFFEEHRKEFVRYGAIAAGVAVLIAGYFFYARSQRVARQEALFQVIMAQQAPVGASPSGGLSFPTEQAKNQQVEKMIADLRTKYSGSDEGVIATYFLAGMRADEGKAAEAEKLYQEAADKGDEKYGSLAKMSLAEMYFANGRAAEGEKILRDFIQRPTIYVTADAATLTLARNLASSNPTEARKLVEPLIKKPGSIGQMALALNGEIR